MQATRRVSRLIPPRPLATPPPSPTPSSSPTAPGLRLAPWLIGLAASPPLPSAPFLRLRTYLKWVDLPVPTPSPITPPPSVTPLPAVGLFPDMPAPASHRLPHRRMSLGMRSPLFQFRTPLTTNSPRRSFSNTAVALNITTPSRLTEADEKIFHNVEDYFQQYPAFIKVPNANPSSDYHLLTVDRTKPFMVTEDTKRLMKSLLDKLDRLHLSGKCLASPIHRHNISASSMGTLKFHEEKTCPSSETGINQNFLDTNKYFLDLFSSVYGSRTIGQLPKDIRHLLDSMTSPSYPRNYLLANHPSLLPVSTRAIAVLKLHFFLREDLPKTDPSMATCILQAAAEPYTTPGDDWVDMVRRDQMMKHWYNFRGGRLYRRNEEGLMDIHRHSTCHAMEHKSKSPKGDYTFEAMQNLLQYLFPLFMPEALLAMSNHKVLMRMRIHELFTTKPFFYT